MQDIINWISWPAVSANRNFYTANRNGMHLCVVYGYELNIALFGWLCQTNHKTVHICKTAKQGKAWFERKKDNKK